MHLIPPNLIDVMLQCSAIAGMGYSGEHEVSRGSAALHGLYAFDHVWVRTEWIDAMWIYETCLVYVTTRQSESKTSVFDCSLLLADREVVMHMKGVYLRTIESDWVRMGRRSQV